MHALTVLRTGRVRTWMLIGWSVGVDTGRVRTWMQSEYNIIIYTWHAHVQDVKSNVYEFINFEYLFRFRLGLLNSIYYAHW